MKIIYITGTRAEYGVMRKLLQMMKMSSKFEVSLIVTAMHLIKEHGYTVEEIKKDNIKIDAEIELDLEENSNAAMSRAIGEGIQKMTNVFLETKPDLVLIAGDRGEILAAAIAAAHLNIPIAHISGGDETTGATIDERIRHALTIFSDIHFPANEESAKNIIKIGENKDLIFAVGNPGVPIKFNLEKKEKEKIADKYQINLDKKLFMVIQHPVTTQVEEAGNQMKITLEAIKKLGEHTIVIYPNSDSGSKDMIKIIEEYENESNIDIYKNIEHEDFHKLLSISTVLIGNSSCALIEAQTFHLPAINIGDRQKGRARGGNVIDSPHNSEKIIEAVNKASKKEFKEKLSKEKNIYAKEDAEQKIIDILLSIDYENILQLKRLKK